MNHKVLTALVAVACVLAPTQQASAWSRFRFNISMNISWEGANNSWLWGLIKSGPGGPSCYQEEAPGGGQGGAAAGYAAVPSPYSNAMAFYQSGYGYNPYAAAAQQMQPQQAQAIQQANYANYYYHQQTTTSPYSTGTPYSYPYNYGRGYYPQNGW